MKKLKMRVPDEPDKKALLDLPWPEALLARLERVPVVREGNPNWHSFNYLYTACDGGAHLMLRTRASYTKRIRQILREFGIRSPVRVTWGARPNAASSRMVRMNVQLPHDWARLVSRNPKWNIDLMLKLPA